MSPQDKTTTERHAKMLRDLIKRPDNRVCADCKHNDPRWASWNLGVYLCIRCSGIHRGMGTHISRVKSIDLDTWTPEQMESIQKWGNHRANLYWEAHLKPGHVPPDHKMESFIRSKYESRRWAMDGPPPSDPSILEGGIVQAPAPAPEPVPSIAPPSQSASPAPASLSARRPAPPSVSQPLTTRQPQAHQLLSAQHMRTQSVARAEPALVPAPQPQPKAPENDLFSLDFHAPPTSPTNSSAPSAPRKDVKQDILSLFSTPTQPAQPAFGAYAAAPAAQSPWGGQYQQQPAAPFSNANPSGAQAGAAWNVGHAWNAPPAAPAPPAQANIWGGAPAAQQQPAAQSLFSANDVWGAAAPAAASGAAVGLGGGNIWGASAPVPAPKKDDVFGDIWGGFK